MWGNEMYMEIHCKYTLSVVLYGSVPAGCWSLGIKPEHLEAFAWCGIFFQSKYIIYMLVSLKEQEKYL